VVAVTACFAVALFFVAKSSFLVAAVLARLVVVVVALAGAWLAFLLQHCFSWPHHLFFCGRGVVFHGCSAGNIGCCCHGGGGDCLFCGGIVFCCRGFISCGRSAGEVGCCCLFLLQCGGCRVVGIVVALVLLVAIVGCY